MTVPVTIVGAGAWGTALAQTSCRAGAQALLWARKPEIADTINRDHANAGFLPGVQLDPKVTATTDLAAAARHARVLVLAVPTQHMREIALALRPTLSPDVPLVIAAKGIEIGTGATVLDIARDMLPRHPLAILSGPTFAQEVALGMPAAVTLACETEELAAEIVAVIGTATFRPYISRDLVGCALGGAVKNVLAIACGIVAGRRLGENARAALITRGLAEMTRLITRMGGDAITSVGLSGLGDLVLTCTGQQSRNYSLGIALGEGASLSRIMTGRRSIAEGVPTSIAVTQLADRLDIDMPISRAVCAILHNDRSIDEMIKQLLARPFRNEGSSP